MLKSCILIQTENEKNRIKIEITIKNWGKQINKKNNR